MRNNHNVFIKKALSMILSVCFIIGIVPSTISAQDDGSESSVTLSDGSYEISDDGGFVAPSNGGSTESEESAGSESSENSQGYVGIVPNDYSSAVTVTSWSALVTAVTAGTPVILGNDITATSAAGGTNASTVLSKNIEIYGDGHTLSMGTYYFRLGGTAKHTLTLENITITSAASARAQHHYGVFQIYKQESVNWDAYIYGVTYEGPAFLGTNNVDATSAATMNAFFENVYFANSGGGRPNEIRVRGRAAYCAVIFARNISISGEFDMYDNVQSGDTVTTVETGSTCQMYFKSPQTSASNSTNEPIATSDNAYAYGNFIVQENAKVFIRRAASQHNTGYPENSAYRSLIYGYENFYFCDECDFEASAGTNRWATEYGYYAYSGASPSYNPYRLSAVITSHNAKNFIVGCKNDLATTGDSVNGTRVNLYTLAPSSVSAYSQYNGWTALYLAKQRTSNTDYNYYLNIEVQENATLDISAENTYNVAYYYNYHMNAPVFISGPGGSKTTIYGTLNVTGGTGDAWTYKFNAVSAAKYGPQDFTVKDGGKVNLLGKNKDSSYGNKEYAAFDAYGHYDASVTVEKGAEMIVQSYGYRGMSMSGGSVTGVANYPKKKVDVQGYLKVNGYSWAIAAEGYSDFSIQATDGGFIDLSTYVESSTTAAGAPSTVYTVGMAQYLVKGEGSKIKMYHNGGPYSAIFHDTVGTLSIDIENGGVMDIYQTHSGNVQAARAAICAQSTSGFGTNHIKVSGSGSSLTVQNKNPLTVTSDTGLYPTGAISFNSTAPGYVEVSNGANFTAISTSLAPTIHLCENTITFDNPGDFEIRNDSTSNSVVSGNSSQPTTFSTVGQAVYNQRFNVNYTSTFNQYNTAIDFKNCDVKVWQLLDNDYAFAEANADNSWGNVSFTNAGNVKVATGKNGSGGDYVGQTTYLRNTLAVNEFELSNYARINGRGSGNSAEITKVSSEDSSTLVEGAKFILYYMGTDGLTEGSVGSDGFDFDSTNTKYYYCYDAATDTASFVTDVNQATVLTSGNDGKVGTVKNILTQGVTYYLEETEAPSGYAIIGDGITKFTTVTDSTTTEVTVENDPANALKFIKVSAKDYTTALSGATFDLYICTSTDENHSHTELTDTGTCWGKVGTATSDSDGLLEFDSLLSGIYLLVETTAPSGYELPQGQWIIEYVAGAKIATSKGTLTGNNIPALQNPSSAQAAQGINYLVGNAAKYDLPLAGNTGSLWFVGLGGVILISLGTIYSVRRIRKKRLAIVYKE